MVEVILQPVSVVLKDLKQRWFSAVYNLFPDDKENFDLSQFYNSNCKVGPFRN